MLLQENNHFLSCKSVCASFVHSAVRQNQSKMLIRQLTQRLLPRQMHCRNQITVLRALSVEPQAKSGTDLMPQILSQL